MRAVLTWPIAVLLLLYLFGSRFGRQRHDHGSIKSRRKLLKIDEPKGL
jgi:hypothetical protein